MQNQKEKAIKDIEIIKQALNDEELENSLDYAIELINSELIFDLLKEGSERDSETPETMSEKDLDQLQACVDEITDKILDFSKVTYTKGWNLGVEARIRYERNCAKKLFSEKHPRDYYSGILEDMSDYFVKSDEDDEYFNERANALMVGIEAMGLLEEHKVLTTWHNPEVDHPEPGMSVVVSFSAKGKYASFDHAIGIGVFLEDDGWDIDTCCKAIFDKTTLKIHGWNDLDTLGVDFE